MKELKRQMVAISEQAAFVPSLERSSGLLSWRRNGSTCRRTLSHSQHIRTIAPNAGCWNPHALVLPVAKAP
jgi:hypothetical protein